MTNWGLNVTLQPLYKLYFVIKIMSWAFTFLNVAYRILLFVLPGLMFFTSEVFSQSFKKGFDKQEYIDLMYISARQLDTPWVNLKFPIPDGYGLIYRSPVVGLDNRWDLWLNRNRTAVISLRGTTKNGISWLENFYAAMLPATGSITINKNFTFNYKLAENQRATVHTGWLIGMACLSQSIVPKIDSLYKSGVTRFYIMGHSQGGALAYLLTAHLHYLQKAGRLPAAMEMKTYCSAAPKPGNLYFAYDYESYTQQGWAYNVVNADDWVPETPAVVQTINDFNEVNPFIDAKSTIKKQKFGLKIAMKVVYRNLVKPTRKAQHKNQKYLGNKTTKLVKKTLPDLKLPAFANTSNYARAGNFITLQGNEDYYKLFPKDKNRVFLHHMWDAYLYLTERYTE